MRNLILLVVSLLVWGCEEEPPPRHHHRERTKDLIGVGVVEVDAGEVWVLAQEVDRWKDGADPIHLDESIPPDYPYLIHSSTLMLEAGGRHFRSILHDLSDNTLVYHYSKVDDGYLIAGLAVTECADHTQRAVPMISVRDENYHGLRWAQTSCEYAYPYANLTYNAQILPFAISELSTGEFLYFGVGGLITCLTKYGEVSWADGGNRDIRLSTISSLRNGGFALTDIMDEVVQLFDNNGVHGRDIEFNSTDRFAVQATRQWENGEYLVAGVELDTPYPHIWAYSTLDSLPRDTTYQTEFCVDSVALYEAGDNMLLACMNGGSCDGPSAVHLILLNSDLVILGQATFGGNTHVVLKDVTVGADGGIFLCGAFDRGNGSYSALVAKYDASLNAVWSTTVHPTQ